MTAVPTLGTPLQASLAVADRARLTAVGSYQLAGHDGDQDLDAVVAHMGRVLHAPIAGITLAGPGLQCHPAELGLGVPRTSVPDAVSFCAHVVAERAPVAIDDATGHPVFAAHPMVAAGTVSSYLGVPLIDEDGFVLGALSVLDSAPRRFTAEDHEVLHVLAGLVRAVLSLRRRVLRQEWDARLLSVQSQVLQEVATGGSLPQTLATLDAAASELSAGVLSAGVDPGRLQTLRHTVDQLAEIATHADDVHRQSKLEALGRLSAGLAHEINTPIQFVGDNVRFLADGFRDLDALLSLYRGLLTAPSTVSWAERQVQMRTAEAAMEVDYLLDEVPRAVGQTLEGVERVSTIVRAMKTFSHPGHSEQQFADLNEALAATLTITRHQFRGVAEVDLDLGELPPVRCNIADLNQAFLNLLVNAADAVQETSRPGTIGISTRAAGESVVVTITDSGPGIPDDVLPKIFDPFFTTKGVGKGTGQGLTLVRGIVQEGHDGSLTIDSERGVGTVVAVRLPIEGRGR